MAKATPRRPDGSFGLDGKLIDGIDWSTSLARIVDDVTTDFIWAPHISAIYRKAGASLVGLVKSELSGGKFTPGSPLTVEVPKSFRMRVGTASGTATPTGPSFTRPGSILLPKDRLLYQAIADRCAPAVESKTDTRRSFSHRLGPPGDGPMFLPNRVCWNEMQEALSKHSGKARFRFVVKLDVADYFRSVNQHQLVNTLTDAGLDGSLADRLEIMLSKYTGQRSSRGIIQGVNPSDLFGAFYLSPIDRQLKDRAITAVRYVDDIYVFMPSLAAADKLLAWLVPALRLHDLALNEMKSVIMPKSLLKVDQPDLEELFDDAMREAAGQDANSSVRGYGFQQEWEDDGDDGRRGPVRPDLNVQAAMALFDSIPDYPGKEEQIERFCLPLLTLAGSGHALGHVMTSFRQRPSMAQIYTAYLAGFLDQGPVRTFLVAALSDASLYDWQRMWVCAGLVQHSGATRKAVGAAASILRDGNRHESLRAAAGIVVGQFGGHDRRLELFEAFRKAPEYVQLAIYYGSRRWPGVERKNARSAWSRDSALFTLVAEVMDTY